MELTLFLFDKNLFLRYNSDKVKQKPNKNNNSVPVQIETTVPVKQQLKRLTRIALITTGLGLAALGGLMAANQLIPDTNTPIDTNAKPVASQHTAFRPARNQPQETSDILVKFKSSKLSLDAATADASVSSFAVANGLQEVDTSPEANVVQFHIGSLSSAEGKIKELKSNVNVESVQSEYQYFPMTNDPRFGQQWALQNTGQSIDGETGTAGADIDAVDAWAVATGAASTTVAVIDTGAAYTHADVVNRMWDGTACVDDNGAVLGNCIHGYDFEDNDKDPASSSSAYWYSSHGTYVSGVVAAEADNNLGIAGVAPNAKIMALKTSLTTMEIIRAIHFAEANGVKIINASWGGWTYDALLADAIAQYDGLFITAAGNYGADHAQVGQELYPCDFTSNNIICVTASDKFDQKAYWADTGVQSVDLAAPGEWVISDSANQQYVPINTTDGFTKTGDFGTRGSFMSSAGSFYGDAVHKPYMANANSSATSNVMNLSGAPSAHLSFFLGCDTEYTSSWDDYMSLEIQNLPTYSAATFTRTWGSLGSGSTQFSSPSGVASDSSGNIYVADTGNNTIKKYSSSGVFVTSWGGSGTGNGQLSSPKNIVVDSNNIVYVYDSGNSRIQKFTAAGVYITQWNSFAQARSLAVDALGYVYQVDTAHAKVIRYYPNGLQLSEITGVAGADQVAVDTSGYVYVTFPSTGLVKVYDEQGYFIYSWGGLGTGQGLFTTISSIAVDGQKNMFVLDQAANRIQVFGAGGTWLATWGSAGAATNQFNTPLNMNVKNQTVAVADTTNHRIQIFTIPSSTIAPGFTELARWNEKSIDNDTNASNIAYTWPEYALPASTLTSNFQLRFRWVTDGDTDTGTSGDGCFVDYLELASFGGTSGNPTEYSSGTSFAAPHVAGVAALLWGMQPSLTSAQVKTFIMDSGDPQKDFQGTTVSGKRLNAYRALTYTTSAVVTGLPTGSTQARTATGTVSGYDVATYKWRIDQGAYSAESLPSQTFGIVGLSEGSHTIDVLSKDSHGVWQDANHPTSQAWKVDLTLPTATFTYTLLTPTKEYVEANIQTSEHVVITNNYGYAWKTFYDNGSFVFTFTDDAGLIGSATATVKNIDHTAPVGTIKYSTTSPTSQSVKAILTVNEPVVVDVLGGALVYSFSSNGSFTFYYHDLAGNNGSVTATVNNIVPAPISVIPIPVPGLSVQATMSPTTPTAGPVTVSLVANTPVTIANNNGSSTIRMFNNGTTSFQYLHASIGYSGVTTTVSNIVTPKLTNFLKVTKGTYTEGSIKIQPFEKYTDTVIGRKVSYSSLGTVYLFLPYKPLGTGSLAVFNGSGQRLQNLTLPDGMNKKGVTIAMAQERSVNGVHLVVTPNKDGNTAAIFTVSPDGAKQLQKVSLGCKKGAVSAQFKSLFSGQQRLVTFINNDVKTIKVWRFEPTTGKYSADTTYAAKHFAINKGAFSFLSSVYGTPTYHSAGGPDITMSAMKIEKGSTTFSIKSPAKYDVIYNWGSTPDFGNVWTYIGHSGDMFQNIPVPAGMVTSISVRVCLHDTSTCTTTPTMTYVGK